MNGPLRVGVGGPVGAGKTTTVEQLCRALAGRASIAVVTNDIYTREDAEALMRAQVLASDRIKGVETGGCPHTAIREDASANLAAIEQLTQKFPDLDVVFIESGGDNLAATFSPELADLSIYVVDVCAGGDIPRKGGRGMIQSDILIVNKTSIAPYVGVSIEQYKRDVREARGHKPSIFANMASADGVEEVIEALSTLGCLPLR